MNSMKVTSGVHSAAAAEVEDSLLILYISNSDKDHSGTHGPCSIGSDEGPKEALRNGTPTPHELLTLLNFQLPENGRGKDGLMSVVESILGYSVNTWSQGFMHKLYASTNAVGVVSELVLAVLNTAVHVYQVSPALTTIEKATSRALASLFGLTGQYAGGITSPGGSASNMTALVIARNTLYPETKTKGYGDRKFVIFTSEDGHYSHEKAAQVCGLGSLNAWPVPVDTEGRMKASELQRLIIKAREKHYTPFFVNATAGTTVLGAYDPLPEIAQICRAENLWLHIDASWGGSVILSSKHKYKMRGSEFADSLTVNPHKMMGVPVTCSFLVGADLRKFWRANTLPAGYLFHGDAKKGNDNCSAESLIDERGDYQEVWDLADLTLQCGRKGDSLKLALGWIYYGKKGYESQIDDAFVVAARLASLIAAHGDLFLVSEYPPPCLQVCFYYSPGGVLRSNGDNTMMTEEISQRLVTRGFMVDHAPGKNGSFFRVVVNLYTKASTVERLVETIVALGKLREQECEALIE